MVAQARRLRTGLREDKRGNETSVLLCFQPSSGALGKWVPALTCQCSQGTMGHAEVLCRGGIEKYLEL